MTNKRKQENVVFKGKKKESQTIISTLSALIQKKDIIPDNIQISISFAQPEEEQKFKNGLQTKSTSKTNPRTVYIKKQPANLSERKESYLKDQQQEKQKTDLLITKVNKNQPNEPKTTIQKHPTNNKPEPIPKRENQDGNSSEFSSTLKNHDKSMLLKQNEIPQFVSKADSIDHTNKPNDPGQSIKQQPTNQKPGLNPIRENQDGSSSNLTSTVQKIDQQIKQKQVRARFVEKVDSIVRQNQLFELKAALEQQINKKQEQKQKNEIQDESSSDFSSTIEFVDIYQQQKQGVSNSEVKQIGENKQSSQFNDQHQQQSQYLNTSSDIYISSESDFIINNENEQPIIKKKVSFFEQQPDTNQGQGQQNQSQIALILPKIQEQKPLSIQQQKEYFKNKEESDDWAVILSVSCHAAVSTELYFNTKQKEKLSKENQINIVDCKRKSIIFEIESVKNVVFALNTLEKIESQLRSIEVKTYYSKVRGVMNHQTFQKQLRNKEGIILLQSEGKKNTLEWNSFNKTNQQIEKQAVEIMGNYCFTRIFLFQNFSEYGFKEQYLKINEKIHLNNFAFLRKHHFQQKKIRNQLENEFKRITFSYNQLYKENNSLSLRSHIPIKFLYSDENQYEKLINNLNIQNTNNFCCIAYGEFEDQDYFECPDLKVIILNKKMILECSTFSLRKQIEPILPQIHYIEVLERGEFLSPINSQFSTFLSNQKELLHSQKQGVFKLNKEQFKKAIKIFKYN